MKGSCEKKNWEANKIFKPQTSVSNLTRVLKTEKTQQGQSNAEKLDRFLMK